MVIGELLACLASRGIHLWVEQGRLRYGAPDAAALDDRLREMVRSRREELMEVLSTIQPAAPPSPIVKAPRGADVLCSHAQQCFLFTAELDGSSDPYRLDAAFRIVGALDVPALAASIADIVNRNEVLRCRF